MTSAAAWRLAIPLGLAWLAGCAETPPPAVIAPAAEVIAPPPVVAEPPPPAALPAPRFAGHVASYKSLAEAEAAWPRLAERFPLLKTLDRRYVEIDLGGQRGKVVRLLVGGFPDAVQARDYCRTLRRSELYCAPHELPAS